MLRSASQMHYGLYRGFSLVELLVAMTIFIVLLAVTVSVVDNTITIWRRASHKIEAFQSARTAFDLLTRELSQATLNTYLDYDNCNNPKRYLRKSDLHFVCATSGSDSIPGMANTGSAVFFQAPASYTGNSASYGALDNALNACGFFVAFGKDSLFPAHASASNRYRFRLMNMLVPIENNRIFDNTTGSSTNFKWFVDYAETCSFPVADNVIALIVCPQDPNDPTAFSAMDYNSLTDWNTDSQPPTANQLPPIVRVTLVAIDEASAKRLENGTTAPAVITDALARFQSELRSNPSAPSSALSVLGKALTDGKINYCTFSSNVPMRESKWNKQ